MLSSFFSVGVKKPLRPTRRPQRIFAAAGLTLSHAKALSNIGEANRQLADYRRSLDAFEQARRLYDSLGALADKGLLLIDTADAYLELNLYPEALAAYQKAHALLRHTGMVHDRARALWGIGSTLIARSEFEEAETALVEAADLFAAAGNAPLLSGVMLEQAALQEARGDHGAAVATARRALNLISGKDWSVQRVYAHLRLADLLLPDAAEAESHLLEASRLAERLALPHLRYRLNERLGSLRRLQGRDEEARVLLEAAVDEIERLRGTVAHETMRASFLRDKITAYEELLKLHLARGGEKGSHSAFAVAERAKSRALVDLLTGAVQGSATLADDAVEGRIRDVQSDLNVTYSRMLGGTDDDGHGGPLPDLRGRAVELEREISQLRLRAAATSDLFAPPEASDSFQHLPSDVTLLAYHVVGDEIVTFFQGQGCIRVVRNPGSAATVARLVRQLDVQWDRLATGREFAERHMALLERLTQRVLTSLYKELIEPLEPLLKETMDWTSDRSRSVAQTRHRAPRSAASGAVPRSIRWRIVSFGAVRSLLRPKCEGLLALPGANPTRIRQGPCAGRRRPLDTGRGRGDASRRPAPPCCRAAERPARHRGGAAFEGAGLRRIASGMPRHVSGGQPHVLSVESRRWLAGGQRRHTA